MFKIIKNKKKKINKNYEYRSKKGNLLGKRVYEIFLFINGVGGLFLLGTFVGTMFNGSDFIVNNTVIFYKK